MINTQYIVAVFVPVADGCAPVARAVIGAHVGTYRRAVSFLVTFLAPPRTPPCTLSARTCTRTVGAARLGACLHHDAARPARSVDWESVERPSYLWRVLVVLLTQLLEEARGRHVHVIARRRARRRMAAAFVEGVTCSEAE